MAEAPRIYVADSDHCVACWRNVFISIWRREPSADRLRKLRSLAQQFMRETTGPICALVLVERTCPVPDDAGRQHSVAFIRDLGERALGIVLVFEGNGFMAAASRAVMVGLMSAAKFVVPYKVLHTVSQAETFFAANSSSIRHEPGLIVEAVERARKQITSIPPTARS